jgi:hypothetical protein
VIRRQAYTSATCEICHCYHQVQESDDPYFSRTKYRLKDIGWVVLPGGYTYCPECCLLLGAH